MRETDYGLRKELAGVSFSEAVARVSDALKEQGFGILTTIDVKATLKEKLDVEHRPYVILGVCNPNLAHRALSTDDNIGLLLPCNVVVAEIESGSEVAIARPTSMLSVAQNPSVLPIAEEAESRLREALERV